ncbi:MAG: phosphatase PAP2 family protein [Bacilli bacterium]|nr:phosphatase PAP2 family protein [Bacilli bacterium]MBP3635399.1 phosphatase PAP2 family protein [Bacilli bacterium]
MNKRLKYIIFLILLIIWILLVYLVKTNKIVNFDNYIYNYLSGISNNNLTSFFRFITYFANYQIIVLLCILLLILIKNKWIGISISINSIFSTIINKILKSIFARPRPDVLKLIKQGGYSFPSGHAMASMSFYGFLIYIIYKSSLNKNIKIILIITLTTLILLIGLSRVYLGVHYASDIITGYITSILCMFIYVEIIQILKINSC